MQIATLSSDVTTIATAGVWCLPPTRLSQREPGMPSSRANAYHILPIDVTDETPQSHIATPITIAMTFAKNGVRLFDTMYSTGYGSFAVAATSPRGIDHVSAISITYPATAETATESTMPHA